MCLSFESHSSVITEVVDLVLLWLHTLQFLLQSDHFSSCLLIIFFWERDLRYFFSHRHNCVQNMAVDQSVVSSVTAQVKPAVVKDIAQCCLVSK